MPKRVGSKVIIEACYLSFKGVSDGEIAAKCDVSVAALSRWRTLPLWKEFEDELIATHKQTLTETLRGTEVDS